MQELNAASSEEIFRRVILASVLTVMPIGVYYRIKSFRTREKLDRRQEGLFILVTLRPIGIAFMVGLATYMINPSAMRWATVSLPDWLRWIGIGLSTLGIVLLFWTFRNLGPNLTDTVVTRRAHTLVTTGPYQWIRHPFYDGVALLTIGTSLGAASWFLLLASAAGFVLLAIRSRTEEQKLLDRFGESYRAYRERTGRFLPKLSGSDETSG